MCRERTGYRRGFFPRPGGVDGCRCGEIMELIGAGKLDVSFLISHRCDLSRIMDAYDMFENKKDHVMKFGITP